MKSPTSFFNWAVLRKNLARFAPAWVLYTVFWVLVIFFNLQGNVSIAYRAENLLYLSGLTGWCNFLYAGICALLLFGDLFKSRLCNALHAMPLRREGWLLTNSVSGFLFALIPYLVSSAVAVAMLPGQLLVVATWFAMLMLQFFFFFGFAIFSVQCSGSSLGASAMYFILNFLFVLVYGLFFYLYQPLLYGINLDNFDLSPFCPVLQMTNSKLLVPSEMERFFYTWNMDYARYLLLCAGAGALLWLLSFPLYRRRKLECAGDFVAFAPVAPVFLLFYTLAFGVVLYMLNGSLVAVLDYALLGVGLTVGFFTGKMLLAKSLRVFRIKSILQFLLLVIFLGGTMVATWMDPLGVTYHVPKAEQIEGMRVYANDDYHSYKANPVAQNAMAVEPEQIAQLQALHKEMTLNREFPKSEYRCNVDVVYYLKDGNTCKRSYQIDRDTNLGSALEAHLSNYQQVFFTNDWDTYLSSITQIRAEYAGNDVRIPFDNYSFYTFTAEQAEGLMAALKADCDAGKLAQSWGFRRYDEGHTDVCWLYIMTDMAKETLGTDFVTTGEREVCLHITTYSTNTIAYLNELFS